LVTELFVYTLFSLIRQNKNIPENVVKRIYYATDFVGYYTKPNGFAPMIGDNDNGRLLPFVPRDFRDHAYLYDIGRKVFGCSGAQINGEYIFMGRTPSLSMNESVSHEISCSGLTVATSEDATLIVTNGGFSLMRRSGGTHTHPDNLSFELCIGDSDFFIDPGTYVYTSNPVMRNKMRATESHNMVTVDGNNLASFSDTSVFVMGQLLSNIELESHARDNSTMEINGSFDFSKGNLQYKHRRTFALNGQKLTITDNIIASGEHKLEIRFIVPAQISVLKTESGFLLQSDKHTLELKATSLGKEMNSKIESYPYSPSYGILKDGSRITFMSKMSNEGIINTTISWKRKG
jgi:hypothetical protein